MLAILIKTKRRTLFSSSADDAQTCSDDLHICMITLYDPAELTVLATSCKIAIRSIEIIVLSTEAIRSTGIIKPH